MYAKLDGYDYRIYYNDEGELYMIRILVGSTNDVSISDISTDINSNNGHIYVEGHYLQLDRMAVVTKEWNHYVEIHVKEEEVRW